MLSKDGPLWRKYWVRIHEFTYYICLLRRTRNHGPSAQEIASSAQLNPENLLVNHISYTLMPLPTPTTWQQISANWEHHQKVVDETCGPQGPSSHIRQQKQQRLQQGNGLAAAPKTAPNNMYVVHLSRCYPRLRTPHTIYLSSRCTGVCRRPIQVTWLIEHNLSHHHIQERRKFGSHP